MKERLNSENRQRLKEEMAGSAKRGRGISARNTSLLMASMALIVSLLLIQTIYLVKSDYSQLRAETTQYLQWQRDASDLQEGSDYLTEQVRCFAETGEREYLDGYFEEAEVTRKRDNAVMRIHEYMGEAPAYHALVSAMSESVALMDREYYAMRLKIEACGYDLSQFPRVLQDVALSAGDDKLPAAEKDALARSMVFDQAYHEKKVAISGKVQECLTELANTFEARGIATADQLYRILSFQRVLIIVSIVITILMVLASIVLIVRPLGRVIRQVQENKPLPIQGAQEIRFLADVYNQMYDTNREQRESITSLLDNMPAMSFYKDVKTGVYKACNQAFADYAHRKTPAEVVGLTDHEIFDASTAAHFVEDDQKALAMDEPYVFFEDVADAQGNPKQLYTTKLKFYDAGGRLRLLGMSMDVTEREQARRENEQAKAAYQEALSTSAVYESIVEALSEDYFDLYYVDVETDAYIEYGSYTKEGQRATERHGADFFAETRENAFKYIYEEDRESFLAAMDKEKLLGEIRKHGAYIYHYRLMIDGVPNYVSMKATCIHGDDRHVIIGISNVDTQVKDHMAAERAAEERRTTMWLSALNSNLIVLYYVDPESNAYTEFRSSKGYKGLGIARQGIDFFRSTYENSLKVIHPEDLPLFHAQVTRENVLATIEREGMFVLAYRLMIGDLPTYVRLKAAKVEEDGRSLLIIGLLDEDAQIRQEQEYARNLSVARKMATVDSLTGIKNKHAYVQWEEQINEAIQNGAQAPFAVAVCDVNNLKAVNDLYGHKAGDACIKNACARICTVFSHSPVFRIGGDEFVVLMTGEDYRWRKTLMEQISALPADHSEVRIGETIAAGMAEYEEGRHDSLLSVFEEADKAMYQQKQKMKVAIVSKDEKTAPEASTEDIPIIHGRKRILIVDDIEMNRDALGELLGEDYDVLFAEDGAEALNTLRSHKDEIDLVLLDLYMPRMSGREVIAEMQLDENLMGIPVIFLTVDQKAELDCLKIGAMDFIPKPYPDIEIIKARVAKCIELSEDRDLIRHTERDKLTGLLNKEYFFRYVERLDHIYKNTPLDAVVCDVSRFHAVNKQYGRKFGDQVLCSIGLNIRKLARDTGGIGCRQGGDTFLLYCPHQDDYEQLLRQFLADTFVEEETANKVSLRFGVFADARREPDVEARFARAQTAAESVKDDPDRIFGSCD